MDPITLALLGGSMIASTAGGIISRNDALDNAKREAAARNSILAGKIGQMGQDYSGINQPAFNTLMAGYQPGAQASNLSGAQSSRGNRNAANVVADNPSSIPMGEGAAPAVANAYKTQLGEANDYATSYGKNMGNLGGYNDAWFNNALSGQDASRQIGFGNSMAEGQKALIAPEQDAAAAASYQPPSLWGPLLQGAGQLGAAYAGGKLGAPSSPQFYGYA